MAFRSPAEEIYQLFIAKYKADTVDPGADEQCLKTIVDAANPAAWTSKRLILLEDQRLLKDDIYPRTTYAGWMDPLGGGQNKGILTLLVHNYDGKYTITEALTNRVRSLLTHSAEPIGTSQRALQPTRSRIGSITFQGQSPPLFHSDREIWLSRSVFHILFAFKE